MILSDSLEDPSFHIGGIKIINLILNYFYLGMLVMCFILALGNRPQGSKWTYTTTMIGFAILTVYMTVRDLTLLKQPYILLTFAKVAAVLLAVKGIENVASVEGRPITFTDIFSNSIFRNIVLSLLATTGLYLVASLIFVSGHRPITLSVKLILRRSSSLGT